MNTTTYVTSYSRRFNTSPTYWRHTGSLLEWHTTGYKWRTQDDNVDGDSVLTHIRLCEYNITNVRYVNHRTTA